MSLGSTGASSPGQQRRAAAAAAPLKKVKSKTKPLELLVIGQQLPMQPMLRRTTKPTPKATAAAPAAEAEPAAAAAPATAHVNSQCAPPVEEQLLEDGDYMYIYRAYPFELWSPATQLDMQQESPPWLPKQKQQLLHLQQQQQEQHQQLQHQQQQQQQQCLPIVQQVLDARFLAELFDELLLCAQ